MTGRAGEARGGNRRREGRGAPRACPLCRREVPFTWRCRCGFELCQACMDDNLWGLTCNRVTWTCPDCGRSNAY